MEKTQSQVPSSCAKRKRQLQQHMDTTLVGHIPSPNAQIQQRFNTTSMNQNVITHHDNVPPFGQGYTIPFALQHMPMQPLEQNFNSSCLSQMQQQHQIPIHSNVQERLTHNEASM